jgi:MraZ protein
MTIPAKWRFKGDETQGYFCLRHPSGYLMMHPPRILEELRTKAKAAARTGDEQAQAALAFMFGQGGLETCDKVGRIKIDRDLLAHAGIDKQAVFVGSGDTFKIYSPEAWQKTEESNFNMLKAMEILGI